MYAPDDFRTQPQYVGAQSSRLRAGGGLTSNQDAMLIAQTHGHVRLDLAADRSLMQLVARSCLERSEYGRLRRHYHSLSCSRSWPQLLLVRGGKLSAKSLPWLSYYGVITG